MKICWFGIYDREYNRNSVLIDGLIESGVGVIECNVIGKGFGKYIDLIKKLRSQRNEYDVLFCAFPVHVCIFIAYFFQSKPIFADAFFPKYESVVYDRKTVSKFSPKAFWYYLLDLAMVKLAKHLITDTEQHKEYWERFVKKDKISVIPVGVNTKEFFPIETVRQSKDFLVQFHGSYIPLQGIDKIVETANILKDDKSIKFRFIGKGQIYKEIKLMIDKYQLDIELIPWLSIPELNKKLNEADIILGVFGETDKADRVVPNKVFQGLAVKKSVITKDTPAIRSLFNDEEIFMCSNSPQDIADSIMLLHKNKELRQSLSQNGYNICMRKFSEKKVPELLVGKLYCYGR